MSLRQNISWLIVLNSVQFARITSMALGIIIFIKRGSKPGTGSPNLFIYGNKAASIMTKQPLSQTNKNMILYNRIILLNTVSRIVVYSSVIVV